MALHEIIIWPDPRLKIIAKPVAAVDDSVRRLIDDLAETMYANRGLGLAATQIGDPRRVYVIDCPDKEGKPHLLAFVNPEILAAAGEIKRPEGCLSAPDVVEEVTRCPQVKLRALDREGQPFELDLDLEKNGVLAIAVQHELDHLDGKVFVEKLSRLKQQLIRRKMQKLKAQRAKDQAEKKAGQRA